MDALFDLSLSNSLAALTPLRVPTGVASSYHLYVLQLRRQPGEPLSAPAARRLALYQRLRDAAILPQVHYIPVHTQPDFVDAGLSGGSFPGADKYYAGCISLPMFPAMDDADMDRVVDCIRAG
jgi:perosamine synthetase